MKRAKYLILGVVIGLVIGLWFGVNIGKDKNILSNPFAEKSLKERMEETAADALKSTKRALRESLDD